MARSTIAAATASLEAYADEIPTEERARIAALATEDAVEDVACVLDKLGTIVVRSTLRPGHLGWWAATAATAGSAETHGLDGASREAYYAAYDAAALAASFVAPAGATLAEANRAASRLLYRASRDAGWRKLTARERARLRLDGAQWVSEQVYAERQAALAGLRADGVGEATHVAASTGGWPEAVECVD